MLFNCSHRDCGNLTPAIVNTEDPAFLHQMKWTSDNLIGELPKEWNHLVGEYEQNPDAKLVHYTNFGVWLNGYQNQEHAKEWFRNREDVQFCEQLKAVSNA